jgi:hypothetical protein
MIACFDFNRLVFEDELCSNFWAFSIKKNLYIFTRALINSLSQIWKEFKLVFMVTMRKIKPCNIHSRHYHILKGLNTFTSWTYSADYLSLHSILSRTFLLLLKDLVEVNNVFFLEWSIFECVFVLWEKRLRLLLENHRIFNSFFKLISLSLKRFYLLSMNTNKLLDVWLGVKFNIWCNIWVFCVR